VLILSAVAFGDWATDANDRIEQFRKRDANVTITSLGGVLANQVVQIKQVKHHFAFGSALYYGTLQTSNPDRQAYEDFFKSHFEWAVPRDSAKWPSIEPTQGVLSYGGADLVAGFCKTNDIKLRGHNLFWPASHPDWLDNLDDANALLAMETRIDRDMGYFEDSMLHWDVCNEMLNNDYFEDRFGSDITEWMYTHAKAVDPDCVLFTNETGVLDGERVTQYIQLLNNLIDHGTPIDAVGIQGHMESGFDRNVMLASLDAMSSFAGLPGTAAVLLSDDFNDAVLDTTKWDFNGDGTVTLVDSRLIIAPIGGIYPIVSSDIKASAPTASTYVRLEMTDVSCYDWSQSCKFGLSSEIAVQTTADYIAVTSNPGNGVWLKIKSGTNSVYRILPYWVGKDDKWDWTIEVFIDKVLLYKDGVLVLDTRTDAPQTGSWVIPNVAMNVTLSTKNNSLRVGSVELSTVPLGTTNTLPIWITEFTVVAADENTRANELEDFYRLAFSHPSVQGILMWGFWAGDHSYGANAAIVDADWTLNAAGERYEALMNEWTTETSAVTDANGELGFRGFHGTYELTVDLGDRIETTLIELPPGDGAADLIVNIPCPTADMTGDCKVDFDDFAVIAADWYKSTYPR
jgi:GH35 family endo-1,4-beta-xylanase